MRQYINKTLIKRNSRLGKALMYTGLGLTIAAAAIVFREPNFLLVALIVMLIGGFLSQIGTALVSRFGREPRIDQIIDASLKGLDDRYATFHYLLGSDHVLVTPEGLFAIIPRLEKGDISYRDGKWYHLKPKRRISLLRRERVLRGIEKEARRELHSLERSLNKHLKTTKDLNTQAMLLFISKEAQLDNGNPPLLSTHRKKLKDTVRSLDRGRSLDPESIRRLATSTRN